MSYPKTIESCKAIAAESLSVFTEFVSTETALSDLLQHFTASNSSSQSSLIESFQVLFDDYHSNY